MVSPAHKRELAQTLVSQGKCSARAACRHFGLHRSTFGYQAKEAAPWLARLRGALRRKSEAHPELGYPKITRLLKRDGWDVGKRLVQRLRQEMGLKCPTKKPRQRRRGPSTGLPTKATHPGHVWTCDFVADRTAKGGSIRMLTVLDEFTRECLCIHVDRHLNAAKVRAVMSELISAYGSPEHIRSDNGSEFIEKSLRGWYADEGIKTLYIESGSPWQNGYIESFNGRLRDECLNREWFYTLTEARVVIEDWRWKYNNIRPHRSLGLLTPLEFTAKEIAPDPFETNPQGMGYTQATPSFRPSLDSLYNLTLNHIINPLRLTLNAVQFA